MGFIAGCLTATILLVAVPARPARALVVSAPIVGMAATPDGGGYWEVASDGGIFSFGDAGFHGSAGGQSISAPIVGMAATPDGGGYWEVASDGRIFSFGDARSHGSAGGHPLSAPIVGMAATPDGHGYWEVASDGRIFSFGDARSHGSAGGQSVGAPIVAMAATPDGHGYWEVASDGRLFSFGDARPRDSVGAHPLSTQIVGLAATPDGHGYWEVGADGQVSRFGDAASCSNAGGLRLSRPIVGMTVTSSGRGCWLVGGDGGIFNLGSAPFHGSMPELPPPGPPRIVLYGDSLVSEAAQDFAFLATSAGASVRVHTFPGTAICDWLSTMAADAQTWQPTAAVLVFSGDAFTPCMAGDPLGTPQYYEKYKDDTLTAIATFRSIGTKVILIGLPLDENAGSSQISSALNQLYQSLAASNVGVSYDDAGQAVMANGQFTWTLPCLPREPCTGPAGTNIVRAPDGGHFCPDGRNTLVAGLEECDVYSSGAFRFASAMLGPALTPPSFPSSVTVPLRKHSVGSVHPRSLHPTSPHPRQPRS